MQVRQRQIVLKYVCGIRFAHIMAGLQWNLSDNPLIQATITSLKKSYPTSSILQKVPLSLELILSLCKGMNGWPVLANLSFDDLVWATASSIAFFAALRGGEFFTHPKSDRPLLTGAAVTILESAQGPMSYSMYRHPRHEKTYYRYLRWLLVPRLPLATSHSTLSPSCEHIGLAHHECRSM